MESKDGTETLTSTHYAQGENHYNLLERQKFDIGKTH